MQAIACQFFSFLGCGGSYLRCFFSISGAIPGVSSQVFLVFIIDPCIRFVLIFCLFQRKQYSNMACSYLAFLFVSVVSYMFYTKSLYARQLFFWKHVLRMRSCRVHTSHALRSSPWFRFPYPLQWGTPVFS
jgi:hypothetical protein